MTSKDLSIYISNFFRYVEVNKVELYNEYSLQHELGIFLRKQCVNYSIQFERNASFFGVSSPTIKKEIDIVVYNNYERFAVELKFPRNGAYPISMFQFIEDICFINELKNNGFTGGCTVVLVDDMNYCSTHGINNKQLTNKGIYGYFRDNNPITGVISSPKKNNKTCQLNGSYFAIWQSTKIWDKSNVTSSINLKPAQYYIIEI